MTVERICNEVDDMIRHGHVDLAGEFDEARSEIKSSRFPRKIEGIDRNAVATEAGPRIEGLKTKRLCRRSSDNFPNINTHSHAEQLQFIDECNIHTTVNILEQLGHLCDRCA